MQPQQPYYGPPGQPGPQAPQPGQPYPPQNPQLPNPVGGPPHPAYDFIMNPAPPPRRSLLGGSGLQQRLLVVGGGVVLLMIIFVVGSSLLKGSNKLTPALTSVVQSQQELIHLTSPNTLSAVYQNPSLGSGTTNFVATANLSLTSAQSQTLTYLQANGGKVKAQALNLKVSTATDKQLTDSAQAGTFNSTYQAVVKTELQNYELALKRAYAVVSGPKGRALLNSDYKQAELLLQQLTVQ